MSAPAELCQLASSWAGNMPPAGYACETKHDGWRALYFPDHDGHPRLWTRNGQPIEGAAHIVRRLAEMERAAGQPLFIDGEFVVDGSLAATKAWCERGWKLGGSAGTFHAFDIVPLAEWRRGGWDAPWHQRKTWLRTLFDQSVGEWDWPQERAGDATVRIVPDCWAFDAADVLDKARRVWASQGEGLMLKGAEAPYERRRARHWLKVKDPMQFARAA